jgi:hypothetical protein
MSDTRRPKYIGASFAPGYRDVTLDLDIPEAGGQRTVALTANQAADLCRVLMDAQAVAWGRAITDPQPWSLRGLPLDVRSGESAPWWADEHRKRRIEEL